MKSHGTGVGSRNVFSLLLLFSLGGEVAAQTAYLVKDLAPGGDRSGSRSSPRSLFAAGGKVFFTAEQQSNGRELWVTDGTASGTELLVALGSEVVPVAAIGPLYLFTVDGELWRSDGTRRGTFVLSGDSLSLDGGEAFALAGRTLYFGGCDAAHGCGLARSDGMPAGTSVVAGTGANGRIVKIALLNRAGGGLAFSTASALWASDGTAAGTRSLHTFDTSGFPSSVSRLTAAASRVFFVAPAPHPQLWSSDGTAAGTRQLTRFAAPNAFYQTSGLKVSGDRVYFVADDVTHGADIWTSDGTPSGTRAVTGFGFHDPFGYGDSGGDPMPVRQMKTAGGRLIFRASDGLTPVKLWSTNGDPASTAPLADVEPATDTSLLRVGGRVVFFDRDGAGWGTDGTGAGTVRLPGVGGRAFAGPFPLLGGAVLATDAGLWLSDGTPAHTRRLTDVALSLYDGLFAFPEGNLAQLGDRLFFPASGGGPSNTELWTSDGRPGGTRLVTEIELGAYGSDPRALTALGDLLFFGTDDFAWRSAGSAGTTASIAAASFFGDPFIDPATAGSKVFFWQRDEHFEVQLWSAGAASPAASLTSFDSLDSAPQLAPLGNRVFFLLAMPAGLEMWASDGTPAGTGRVFGLDGLAFGDGLRQVGQRLYFVARTADGDSALWVSDGTSAGTRQLLPLGSYVSGSELTQFTPVGSLTCFLLDRASLLKTDGTAAGSGPVFDDPGGASRQIKELAVLHGSLYALGYDGSSGQLVLWRSDGTAAGTSEVRRFDQPARLPDGF